MKELEIEAEKYLDKNYNLSYEITTWQRLHIKTFIAGATSSYVEQEKIKFAIEQLKCINENNCTGTEHQSFYDLLNMKENKIKELEQKLVEYGK